MCSVAFGSGFARCCGGCLSTYSTQPNCWNSLDCPSTPSTDPSSKLRPPTKQPSSPTTHSHDSPHASISTTSTPSHYSSPPNSHSADSYSKSNASRLSSSWTRQSLRLWAAQARCPREAPEATPGSLRSRSCASI